MEGSNRGDALGDNSKMLKEVQAVTDSLGTDLIAKLKLSLSSGKISEVYAHLEALRKLLGNTEPVLLKTIDKRIGNSLAY